MRILIAGATGNTGTRLTNQLAEAGHEPIALVRETSDTSALPAGCETRQADLTDLPEDVAKGVDAVIFAAGSGGDTSAEMTDKVDRDGAMALVDRSEQAGVKRFVMLSSVGTDDPDSGPDAMQHYLKAKRAADDHLIASGLNYVIVRPVSLTDDYGTGEIELSTDHVDGKKISRDDVAAVLAECATAKTPGKVVFEIAGRGMPVGEALATLR
ncbi:SDR family oxidoreductase [Aquisalinus flavus]|uniref:NAD dependent epimerase/dehydratase n=1 Tax=Aquisalinus flavus TaxID=1526572 RepID=A0A8J2V5E2_9PROT|nr:SDR family oxidoreductase [Aquisalinus flavus]MBD0426104.1 SDR family oxidoreductase [Aquisalinus flavus]UNE48311.1 SDR family oxidoreductase [Aquisalinus flavus]GGD10602.1 NAD dependent epimerase/dehydratase [Aquisalinus flavus]